MADTGATQEFCPNCTKFGLPILPLRYAVARDDVKEKAPPLVAPFGDGVNDVRLPAGVARYTLRTLRQGYLYVFNDMRGRWSAYQVAEDGVLFQFDIRDRSPPPATSEDDAPKEVCSRHGNPPLSQCILVPDAANATILWMAFSDVAWTPEVFKRYSSRNYRKKHMRQIDVGAWFRGKGNRTQPHMDRLDKLVDRVSEYHFEPPAEESQSPEQIAEHEKRNAALPPEERSILLETVTIRPYPACDYSPHDFKNCKSGADAMTAAANQAGAQWGYPPAMVALDDPLGITMELATMMSFQFDRFMARPQFERPLAISAILRSLEDTIRSNAELEKIKSRKEAAVSELEYWRNIPWTTGEGPRDPNRYRAEVGHYDRMQNDPTYRAEWQAKVADAEQTAVDSLTPEDLKRSAESAWARYRKKLRRDQPQLWSRNTFEPELRKLDRTMIVPLARAHNAWMESDALLLYFDGNFDDQNIESGIAFVDAVLLCVQDSQQNAVSFDKYRACLSAAKVDEKNYFLRAMAYNQKEILDGLKAAVSKDGIPVRDLPSVPWKSIISLYQKSLKDVNVVAEEGGNSSVARLIVALAGPVMKALDDAVDKSVGALVVALGGMGKAPVVYMQATGFVSDMLDDFVAKLQQEIPALNKVDPALLKDRIKIKTRGGNRTMTPAGKGRWNMQVRFDRFTLGNITEKTVKKSPSTALNQVERAIMASRDALPDNAAQRWRAMFNTNFKLGVVQGLFQLWSTFSAAKALDGAMAHRQEENGWKFTAAVAGSVGAFATAAGDVIEGSYKIGGRLAPAMNGFWHRALQYTARAVGLFAAVVLAFWDLKNMWAEARQGNVGMAALYLASGIAGIGAALLLTGWLKFTLLGLTATGWGLLLAAIVLVVGLLIAYFKDDDLQDWMERCFFGAFAPSDRYVALDEELEQFKIATKQTDEAPKEDDSEDQDHVSDELVPQGG